MIKCKLADITQGSAGCPEGKNICCHQCEQFQTCKGMCGEPDPATCADAIFEGETQMEVFQNKASVVVKAIASLVTQKKALEDQEKQMKEQLKTAMELHGITKFEGEGLKINYFPENTKTAIDSVALKNKYPDIAAECVKVSAVKSFIKITVKGGEK